MNKLELNNFKAFQSALSINISNKNLLLYGENGSGKSSIFEALKIIFYKSKIQNDIPEVATPEDQANVNQDFWDKYNNQITNTPFDILVNDTNYNEFQSEDYQAFLISMEDIVTENKLKLGELLSKFYVDIEDINEFCELNYNHIKENVNNSLVAFNETIKIDIDLEENYAIVIKDQGRNVETSLELKKYFNEAKLNLVILLTLFNSIQVAKDETKSNLIILDDFITSLDAANRTFLLKFILEKFSEFQVFIFTHNVSFYNLALFMINSENNEDKWNFANLYEIGNKSKLYTKEHNEKVIKIKQDYEALPENDNNQIEEIGNRLRQKFEILLYELSKLISVGAVEESNTIIDRIRLGKNLYYKNKKTAPDLIDEIKLLLDQNHTDDFTPQLIGLIDGYKLDEFTNLRNTIQELRLYQKVTLHPMSHGQIGQSTFTTNEIEKSINLLIKLEKSLNKIINKDVVTI